MIKKDRGDDLAPQPPVSLRAPRDERKTGKKANGSSVADSDYGDDEIAGPRSSGYDLAFSRMSRRRVGGDFAPVEDDGQRRPLRQKDVIRKGEHLRTAQGDRFIPMADADTLARQFAEQEGSAEALEAFRVSENALLATMQMERDSIEREEAAIRAAEEAAGAAEREEQERLAAEQQRRDAEWHSEFYGDDDPDRDPTAEEEEETAALAEEAAVEWNIDIDCFATCRFPEDVGEIVEMRKQFNEIDFDKSGQVDKFEMQVALRKLGMDLTPEQIGALLSEGDESADAELDFTEFVAFVARFKSSAQEKAHQGSRRKSSVGLEDALKNMNLVRVETEFGSEYVVQRKETLAWENFMEFPDPLHWACGKGDLEAVKQFIAGRDGAPRIRVDYINKDGKMPVHYAAVWNQTVTLKFLLDPPPHGAGAHPDPTDPNWMTPLYAACQRGCKDTAAVLISHWANFCQRDLSGTTPLFQAVTQNHPEVLDQLLCAGSIVSGGDDQSIRVWTLDGDLNATEQYGGHGPCKVFESDRSVNKQTAAMGAVYCLQVLQDRLVTGHYDGSARLSPITLQQGPHPYDVKGLTGTRVFRGHEGPVLCVRMEDTGSTVDGKWVMTGSEDATARLFELATGVCVRVFRDTRDGTTPAPINGVDFCERGDRVVAGTRFGWLLVWRFSDGATLATLSLHPASSITALHLRGDWVLTGSHDRAIKLSSLAPKVRGHTYTGHESAVQCLVRVDGDAQGSVVPAKNDASSEIARLAWPDSIVSATGEILIWTLHESGGMTECPRAALRGENGQPTAHAGGVWDLVVFFHGACRMLAASSTPDAGVAVWNLSEPGLQLPPLESAAPSSTGGASGVGTSVPGTPSKGPRPRSSSGPVRRFKGHSDDVRCVGWYGVDVNLTDPTGTSPLMVACDRGHTEIARRLLATVGINVWLGDRRQGETALHKAAKSGHVACVDLLLQFDPSLVRAVANHQLSVLHSAVEHEQNSPAVARACLAAHAELNFRDVNGETALHRAAALGHWRVLDVLANHPDVDKVSIGAEFPIGGEPLMRPRGAPAEQRHPRLVHQPVQFSLTRQRWVRGPSGSARASGDYSTVSRRIEVTEQLRLVRQPQGWTALHTAAAFGRSAATKVLLDAGWSPNALDDMNRSPLHLACANGTPDIVKLLVECGCDVNARDKLGAAPLHYCVKTSQESAAKTLLACAETQGTPVMLEAREEVYALTALQMAAKYGLEDMTFLLLDAGADKNAADERLATPMHYACYGAVGEVLDRAAPEVSAKVARAGFGERDVRRAAGWVQQWRDATASTKGFGSRRLDELRREVENKFGRFVQTAEVLLDGFARYDARDARGRTAREIVQADPAAWAALEEAFGTTQEDGQTFVMPGDVLTALFLGDRGTRFEHPNKWRLVTTFGVKCEPGGPTLSGSRAFKKPVSRHAAQEVDYRALGDFEAGQAGVLQRRGCALYMLAVEYMEDFSGLNKEAHSLLCRWDSAERTFETKFNTVHVSLDVNEVYQLRVLSVEMPPSDTAPGHVTAGSPMPGAPLGGAR